ncbi:MAG: electron transport complex subunit E [Firmicutes bacterium]|nr:electron transport complex subunit E [Bacillota bacterium]
MSFMKEFRRGLVKENPTFSLLLGMCPTLAVTTAAANGLGMGLATTAVLTASNLLISLIRNVVPNKIRIPVYVVVIASFVTVVDLVMQAFLPGLHAVLGLFIPLIVVNCIILQRAEAFASQHGPLDSIADGLGMGLGFTGALTILGSIREIIGAGTIFGKAIFGASYQPMLIMILAPGAFLTLGLLIALLNYLRMRRSA